MLARAMAVGDGGGGEGGAGDAADGGGGDLHGRSSRSLLDLGVYLRSLVKFQRP